MMNDEFGFNQQPDPQQPSYPQPDVPPQASYAPPAGGYAPPAGENVPLADAYAPPTGGNAHPAGGYAPPNGGYVPPTGGYVPPAGGYVPPAGGYTPPNGGYAPYYRSKAGKGGAWIGFLRVFLWIWFGLVCLLGVVACIGSISVGEIGVGFLCLLGCVLVAFLSVAGGMIALDACANISRCATNSARILALLQQKK